ncbi:hypothetical protein AWENTII_002700 [Aspergillus wentii]
MSLRWYEMERGGLVMNSPRVEESERQKGGQIDHGTVRIKLIDKRRLDLFLAALFGFLSVSTVVIPRALAVRPPWRPLPLNYPHGFRAGVELSTHGEEKQNGIWVLWKGISSSV